MTCSPSPSTAVSKTDTEYEIAAHDIGYIDYTLIVGESGRE
jgi:hypothetical protein